MSHITMAKAMSVLTSTYVNPTSDIAQITLTTLPTLSMRTILVII